MAFGLHTSPVVVVAIIWLGCISLSCPLPLCDSDRPNSWATHRTLTLPQHMITGITSAQRLVQPFCFQLEEKILTNSRFPGLNKCQIKELKTFGRTRLRYSTYRFKTTALHEVPFFSPFYISALYIFPLPDDNRNGG